jgi:hypothetical protein
MNEAKTRASGTSVAHFATARSEVAVVHRLRLLVGFLGEKKQHGWRAPRCMDATARAASKAFTRTAFEGAQGYLSEAASVVENVRTALLCSL